MERLGCGFAQTYGLTETSGGITVLTPEDHEVRGRLTSCGRPFPGVELQIRDAQSGIALPTGDSGEVWTRSFQNMVGYWRQPEATAAALPAGGWLRTGDVGHLDGDGYLYLHDRLNDMIVTGGENVYPAEVEHALLAHPAVHDAAVIGLPHERWGETVSAVVVATPGAALEPQDLIVFIRGRLAHFKCPTSVRVVDELPRNASGKLLRRELRRAHTSSEG
jgi:acyl-CoA synthetase (AMP-forming)/AMP-acid ligase II